jgi:hypothetical protein
MLVAAVDYSHMKATVVRSPPKIFLSKFTSRQLGKDHRGRADKAARGELGTKGEEKASAAIWSKAEHSYMHTSTSRYISEGWTGVDIRGCRTVWPR